MTPGELLDSIPFLRDRVERLMREQADEDGIMRDGPEVESARCHKAWSGECEHTDCHHHALHSADALCIMVRSRYEICIDAHCTLRPHVPITNACRRRIELIQAYCEFARCLEQLGLLDIVRLLYQIHRKEKGAR